MLSKKNRISSSAFGTISKKTKRMSHRLGQNNVSLSYTHIPGQNKPKFSVVVAKKVTSGAVDRNRLRRIVYSHLENKLSTFCKDIVGIFTIHKYAGAEKQLLQVVDELIHKADLCLDKK